MKKLNLILLIILTTFTMNAQKDTLYFDNDWKETSAENAAFYRLIPLEKVGELYLLKDYFINGNLQMEGLCIDPQKEDFHGLAIWYHKDGSKSQEVNYQNGIKKGKATFYYSDEIFRDEANHPGGIIRQESNYKDGNKDGLAIYYYTNGVKSEEIPFVNGIKNGKATVYLSNGIKSMELTYKDGERIGESTFFYEDGTVVGTCIYKNNKPFEGIEGYSGRGYHRTQFEIYKEGKKISGYDLYEGTKQIAFQAFDDENRRTSKLVFYYKDGTKIGERTFDEEGRISDGPDIDFERGYNFAVKYLKTVKQEVNGKTEGEVVSYNPEGEIIAKGICKNGHSFSGSFYHYEGRKLTFYKDGSKVESISYDENGEIIAKGTYKNGVEFNGQFYWSSSHAITFYKDGKEQEYIEYENDERKRIMYQVQYGKGKAGKLVRTAHYDIDETYECIYKDEKPFNGQFFKFYELTTYKDGEKTEYIKYEEKTGKIESKSIYKDRFRYVTDYKDGAVVKEMIFKDGEKFQGVFGSDKYFTTYKEGKKQGPFSSSVVYSETIITGNCVDDKMEGKITFNNAETGEVYHCEFKNGQPIDGTLVEDDRITQYKNGEKQGLETQTMSRNTDFDLDNSALAEFNKITRNYNAGILDGDITYFLNEAEVGKGIYKNGDPFDGTFYDERYKTILSQGKLIQKTYDLIFLIVQDNYENEILKERISVTKRFDEEEEPTEYSRGTFLNGQPYEGTILTYDDGISMMEMMMQSRQGVAYDKKITTTNYKNGQKEGPENLLIPGPKAFNMETIYKADLPISVSVEGLDFLEKEKITGTYKDGLPHDGQFYTKGKIFSTLSSYENGKILTDQYFLVDIRETIQFTTLKYKDGKPLEGQQLEVYVTDCHQHFYENGKRIKTRIYPIHFSHPQIGAAFFNTENTDYVVMTALYNNLPGTEILYTETGFESQPIEGYPDTPHFKLSYKDETKSSGTATSNHYHLLEFDKEKVVRFELFEPEEEDDHSSPQIYCDFDDENRFYQTSHEKDFFTQRIINDPFPAKPDYKDFYYLMSGMGKNITLDYFLKMETESFATLKMTPDGTRDGHYIEEDYASGLYNYSKFENGEYLIKDEKLTFAELLKIIKGE